MTSVYVIEAQGGPVKIGAAENGAGIGVRLGKAHMGETAKTPNGGG